MSTAFIIIKRNIKLFFKDKGMFFTSLITPAILLVLYVTFLGNVYRDSFTSNLPDSLKLSEDIIEGLVGGQLISSILAVSCVTVAFCSNFLMVQDKSKWYDKRFTNLSCKGGDAFAELLCCNLVFNTYYLLCCNGDLSCFTWLLSVGICRFQIYSFCFLTFYFLFCLEQHYLRLSIFSYQHKDKFQR